MDKEHETTERGNGGGSGPPEEDQIKPVDYLRAVVSRLRSGKQKDAYGLLMQAVVRYPDDPIILSFFGSLQAIVDKKHRSGVETCKRAIDLLKGSHAPNKRAYFPTCYLNLGRAYLAAGKKPEAIEAFRKGLTYDPRHGDLNRELQGLGVRKPPPVPFLGRSNVINKYIGLILHRGETRAGGTHKAKNTPQKPTR